ncbi:ribonuclease III [Sphingomonas naphthae]|uniref:Ribonuclease 3 n=1 Tax=Sphingomonas naphthae TaxID=1813468 RepID=A0ABY7TNV7_9SPHN|nr:ribonuclease III [Sphingomonas naphthae]WCT74915.1 ribonuclease III [Sphingomonas naphthae]
MNDDLTAWIESALGHAPRDPALFLRALTHASQTSANYERLEFLGDKVLGVVTAAWLYRIHPDEPEGALSRRLNAVVSRETCAEVGRAIGVPQRLVLGKQARDDGVIHSDNVVGDAVEALIGALFLENGLDAARPFVERAFAPFLGESAPRHPKAALQEWAAANRCRPPVYALERRSGPDHAPRFLVSVALPGKAGAEANGEGASKREAESEAARTLLERLK